MIKIITFTKNKKIVCNHSWIYIGSNYLNVLECEKNIAGKRISLSPYLEKYFEILKPILFKWIEKQRLANDDQLDWWMCHLAGKNNAASKFFTQVLQIFTLKELLDEDFFKKSNYLIICEDIFILNSVRANLGKNDVIDLNNYPSRIILKFLSMVYYFARALYIIVKQIYKFSVIYFLFRKRTFPNQIFQNEVYLVHQCLDNNSFLNDNFECRYFNELPSWLESKGKKVYRIPWLLNVSLPLKQVFKKIRHYDCFVYHDYISYFGFLKILFISFKSYKKLKYKIEFENLNIFDLVFRERLLQIGNGPSFVNFWCYYDALKKFTVNIKSLKIISAFEMMVHEHVQNSFTNDSNNPKYISVGYYHSLMSRDFLGYYPSHGDINSRVFPDYIITNGSISKKLLRTRGIPEKRLIEGPSLRQRIVQDNSNKEINLNKTLLLVLSLNMSHSIEIINHINSLYDGSLKQLRVSVSIKTHPMQNKNKILRVLGWEELPNNFFWADQELSLCLKKCRAAVTSGSGSIFDIVLARVIPIPLKPELELPWNYIDPVDTDDLFSPVSKDDLGERIKYIFTEKNSKFQKNIESLNKKVTKGLGKVNEKTLKKFIDLS